MKELIEAINNSPQIVRDYIHELEIGDMSAVVQELFMVKQQRDGLLAIKQEEKEI